MFNPQPSSSSKKKVFELKNLSKLSASDQTKLFFQLVAESLSKPKSLIGLNGFQQENSAIKKKLTLLYGKSFANACETAWKNNVIHGLYTYVTTPQNAKGPALIKGGASPGNKLILQKLITGYIAHLEMTKPKGFQLKGFKLLAAMLDKKHPIGSMLLSYRHHNRMFKSSIPSTLDGLIKNVLKPFFESHGKDMKWGENYQASQEVETLLDLKSWTATSVNQLCNCLNSAIELTEPTLHNSLKSSSSKNRRLD